MQNKIYPPPKNKIKKTHKWIKTSTVFINIYLLCVPSYMEPSLKSPYKLCGMDDWSLTFDQPHVLRFQSAYLRRREISSISWL
jgi:hypothetical protein